LDVKRLFTLDSLGDHIAVYNLQCELDKKISPKVTGENKEIIILDFAWSARQKRVMVYNLF
jgi:hypothetical protein